MAQAQLTDRQQEVHNLMQQGKKPAEIAKQLKISTNAVYQQIRRMRKGGTSAKSGRKSGGQARTASRQATPRPLPAEVRVRPMTPLQSIRARRSEIEGEVKESASALETAEKAVARAKDAHATLQAKHKDEIKALDAAEAALTKKPAAPAKPKAQASTNGKPQGDAAKAGAEAAAAAA